MGRCAIRELRIYFCRVKKLNEIKSGIIEAQEHIILFKKNGWMQSAIRARWKLKEVRSQIVELEKELLEEKNEIVTKRKKLK